MGGVTTQPVSLTADVMARAVIAAAKAYGDDPIEAFRPGKGAWRRSLLAAADGLSDVSDVSLMRICRSLTVANTSVSRARASNSETFRAASRAASRAANYAGWRLEARETVVEAGGCAPPVIIAPAGEDQLADDSDGDDATTGAANPLPGEGVAAAQASIPRPAPSPPTVSEVPAADRPVRDQVLDALAKGALNTLSLAHVVDRKEMTVSSALTELERAGLVESRPVADGPRRLEWMLKVAAAA